MTSDAHACFFANECGNNAGASCCLVCKILTLCLWLKWRFSECVLRICLCTLLFKLHDHVSCTAAWAQSSCFKQSISFPVFSVWKQQIWQLQWTGNPLLWPHFISLPQLTSLDILPVIERNVFKLDIFTDCLFVLLTGLSVHVSYISDIRSYSIGSRAMLEF